MIPFSFRSWLTGTLGNLRCRSRRNTAATIERLECRVVLSAYSVTSTLDAIDANPGDGIAADVAGNATLRSAVMDANASAGSDTITLGAGVFTLSLSGAGENAAATGDLDVTGNLVIEGAGADQTFLDADLLDRYFHVQTGASLTLKNVTIRNGRAADGGAIQNDGTLVLDNVELTANAATVRGGAIFNNAGQLTLQSVKVLSNESRNAVPTGSNSFGGGLASVGGSVTIQGGQFTDNFAATFGGAIYASGATLNLTGTAFSDNSAMTGGAVRLLNGSANLTDVTFNGDHGNVSGGAIASSYCTLTITGGSFTDNYLASASSGGEARSGGALYLLGASSSSTTVNIRGVTFQQTGGGDGGAIYNSSGRLNLLNSTFDRIVGERGGAIWNTATGEAAIWNTTITGSSGREGGAILNNGYLQLVHSTISGNKSGGVTLYSAAVAGVGGGIESTNNIIAGNILGDAIGGGDFLVGGGGNFRSAGTSFAAPQLNNATGYDVAGTFSGFGGNLIGNRGYATTGFDQLTDRVGTPAAPIDALLLPLADNGGPVKTMALSAQSPARDGGIQYTSAPDARGMPRTDGRPDSGAYEFQNHVPQATTFTRTINYGEVLTGQLVASDEDGDTVAFLLQQPVTYGTVVLELNGQFTYTPPPGAYGTAYFAYVVSDGHSTSPVQYARIIVRPYNIPPVVDNQSFAVPEGDYPSNAYAGFIFASDPDSSQLNLEIVSGNESGIFGLNSQSRTLYVRSGSHLNFETTPTYTLVVKVTDNGIPAASTFATITVQVQDVNEPPVGINSTITISENLSNGSSVGSVLYTDEDIGEPHQFAIAWAENLDAFAVNSVTGEITVANTTLLDYETQPQIRLYVRITDSGYPANTTYSQVTVRLTDANDAPQLLGPDSMGVDENAPAGIYVGRVFGNDVDPGQSLTYEILSGNTDGAFSINPVNGSLWVANSAALNYEAVPSYALVIRATDNGSPNLSTTKTITVFVNDLNEAPQIDMPAFSLPENSANGTVVGSVTATDPDVGQVLTYSFFSGNNNGAFAINPLTGQITVANVAALDFETTPVFNLQVVAADNYSPSYGALTTVVVTLVDVAEGPVIASHSFSINENSSNGATVGTVTATAPSADLPLTYAIISGNTNGAFAMNPATGLITVANSAALNFEVSPTYELMVSATSSGPAGLTATARVLVTLNDLNEVPQLSGNSFSLDENSPVGTIVGTLTGTDPDAGQSLTYSIVSGNTNGAFAIDSATGQITVGNMAALNFETTPTFSLVIRVTDSGTPTLGTNATVGISLNNVNDPPVLAPRSFTLSENSALGKLVGTITGTDADSSQPLTYAITGGNINGAFTINAANGQIKVANVAALDFETVPVFTLEVTATDQGSPAASSTTTVTISLTNVNERPVIAAQAFSVDENAPDGTVVGTVVAADPDADQMPTYSITSGNTNGAFAIDPLTGQITVVNSAAVNFESRSTYTLSVRVTDPATPALTANAAITVSLVNLNEAPIYLAKSFTVKENLAVGATVGTASATDPDVGQTLTYAIVSGNTDGAFAINPTTGKITVATPSVLNYELIQSFTLVVSVTDNGDSPLSTNSTVTISVTDVNEAPLITPQAFSIVENSAGGTEVGTVVATDPDPGQTRTYSIVSGNYNEAFAIDAVTGQITVANSAAVNFESRSTYTLSVRVTDSGTPALTATAAITVSLVNVNEAPIYLAKSFTVKENLALGATVGTATGTDPDAGQALTYAIVSGNTDGAFAINPTTGKITVATPSVLNYELVQSFTLVVSVTDNGDSPLSTNSTVTISVTDVNEAPLIAPQAFSVVENSAVGTEVGAVVAADPDPSQTLTYSIVSGNYNGAFAIDPVTGQITVANSSAVNFESRSTYTLSVRVTDSGTPALTATAAITVSLVNVNEAPIYLAKSFTVKENLALGATVGTASGTDPDVGQTLTYAIVSGNTNGAFAINPTTGKITVATPSALDYELVQSFTLVVSATDNGDSALSTNSTVTISVTDVNEGPLITPQTFSIAENSEVGAEVGSVLATDSDAGQSVTYSISSGNTSSAFAIDPSTGRITVANPAALDFEIRPSFTLQVRATDNGLPVRSAVAAITIQLTDIVETLVVGLDVVPGSSANNVRMGQTFEVAIRSTSTFNALNINVDSVRFGKLGTEDSVTRNADGQFTYSYRDVNNDGRLDLVVVVATNSTGLQVGDTLAGLTGSLNNGQPIVSSSAIVVRA